jgi:hypothetical protein
MEQSGSIPAANPDQKQPPGGRTESRAAPRETAIWLGGAGRRAKHDHSAGLIVVAAGRRQLQGSSHKAGMGADCGSESADHACLLDLLLCLYPLAHGTP